MTTYRSWSSLIAGCSLWLLLSVSASSQESLADLPSFRDGCRALADSRYETAADFLQQAWNTLEVEGAGEVEKEFVATRLLEAWVRNGNASQALRWLDQNPSINPSPARLRWSATAYQDQLRFAEAAETYSLLRGLPRVTTVGMILDHALCLSMIDDAAGATELLKELPPLESPDENFQAALLASRTSDHRGALEYLELAGDSISPLTALNLQAWNLIQLGNSQQAAELILDDLESAEDNAEQLKRFLLLEAAVKIAATPLPTARLEQWANTPDSPLQHGAAFFLALSETDESQQQERLEKWLELHPAGPFSKEARLRLGMTPLIEVELAEPPSTLDLHQASLLASTEFLEGLFQQAAEVFLELADSGDLENRNRSLYNTALAALKIGDFETFLVHESELRQRAPGSSHLADLIYLAGLFRAARAESDALDYLQSFIRDYPNHPKRIEGQLALAEIHLNQVPARPQAARQIIESLGSQALTLAQSERLDYTGVWLELIENDDTDFLERAETFLREWPGSSYYAEVSMLLARELFEANRLDEARELFERVARNFPDSPFAETAPIFAARSRKAGDEAILAWKTIAYGDSPYALEGLHELGLTFMQLDRFEEARTAFSELIEQTPAGNPLYFAACADTGYAYYLEALAKGQDEDLLLKAAEAFSELSRQPDAPDYWKYSAALRRARCLEAVGNQEVALEIYRSIVSRSANSDPSVLSGNEFRTEEWVFSAGFFAIQILQENQDWRAAIKMADDLARKNGPRAIEASELAEQMRLKHWVWD